MINVTVIGLLLLISHIAAEECDQLLIKSDTCMKRMVFLGDHEAHIPRELKDMNSHCSLLKSNVKCFRQYGHCLKLFPKQVFNVINTNAKKFVKERCETTEGRTAFLSHMKCYTKEGKERYDLHVDRLVALVDFVAENVTNDLKLPHVCCGYHLTSNLLGKEIAKHCDPLTVQFTEKLSKVLFADVLDLSCGRYSDLQNCKQLLPEVEVKLNEISSNKNFHIKHSFWVPFVKIFRSLDAA